MHSHHSHSGQYVQHAQDSLQQVVDQAIDKKFTVFCLTEHMPRYRAQDLYPEEIDANVSTQELESSFAAYHKHARQLQTQCWPKIHLLVGFETENIYHNTIDQVLNLKQQYPVDLLVGSVHHVGGFPIDYSHAKTQEAQNVLGVDMTMLFELYLNAQYELLRAVKPQVVGHFDLVRLFCTDEKLMQPLTSHPRLWPLIKRNVDYAISIDALFEVNSAAVRKGWTTPYPSRDVAEYIAAAHGKFCLSDDSHGVQQVGLNYHVSLAYLRSLGQTCVYYLDKDSPESPVKICSCPI